MNRFRQLKPVAWLISILMVLFPLKGIAEDIDIFVGASSGSAGNPNVLIVFDNTSNWSRNNQHFPGVSTVGGMEVAAVKTAVASLDQNINVGIMEYVTASGNYNQGGFVRFAVKPLDATNKTSLNTLLDYMGANVTSPDEKLNSNVPYGGLMYDVANYFAGNNAWASTAAVPSSLADTTGYNGAGFSRFLSPLSCSTNCAKNFIILIANPDSNGPSSDSSANTGYLSGLGGTTSQLKLYTDYTYTTTTATTDLGTSSQCYASQAACNTALASTSGADYLAKSCADYSAGCSCSTSVANETVNCASSTATYRITTATAATTTVKGTTNKCYSDSNGSPSNYPHAQETAVCSSGQTTSFSNRAAGGQGCNNKYTYTVSCTTAGTSSTAQSLSCYDSTANCTTAAAASCPVGSTCSCGTPTASTYTSCSATPGSLRYSISGATTTYGSPSPTGNMSTDTNPWNADEWSRFMYREGIPVSGCDNQKVTTYTIDTFYAQPDDRYTGLLNSMATWGGGKYFAATSATALANALKKIFQEIQSVNSTFASASLPINATNRSQNENQVYIGMFRPSPDAVPRWFGNVKRYQLVKDSSNNLQLGDKTGAVAINLNTGFIDDCATSYWTTDSPNPPGKTDNSGYWSDYPITPTPAGKCTTTAYNAYSDAPDGPRVEKGAVAEVIRKGNVPTGTGASVTYASPDWQESRTVYTYTGSATPGVFDTTNSGLSDSLVKWVRGQDVWATDQSPYDENSNGALGGATATIKETRASLHGDVVHSRPLPITYADGSVVLYYGANDGTLRAVDASNGQEKWAFVAPEHYSKLDRLRLQSPSVLYPDATPAIPGATKRDYFFDGSIGLYQTTTAPAKAWIFPTMRRGGRMVYAFDVTTAASPTIKWKFGCPNLGDDSSCTDSTYAPNIGQTWSIPNIAKIKGYSTTAPVVVIGGGYDSCEDTDSSAPSCGSAKGKAIFVLDANTGAVVKQFTTSRSVASDVALIDVDYDGYPDFGYVGDTGGNLYRLNFAGYDAVTGLYTARAASAWTITRIAYTETMGHKFLFAPALYGGSGKVFVALGSGDREHPLESDYPYAENIVNRFYVYRDCHSTISTTNTLTGGDNLNSMTGSLATSPPACNANMTTMSNCSDSKGWYLSLNNGTGEQTVTSALISGGMVTFSTNRPIPAAAGSCATSLGEARGYWLDLYNGSGAVGVDGSCGGTTSTTFVGGGLPPSPVAGTVTIDGVPTSVIIGAAQKTGGASSPISPQKASPTSLPARKRVYSIIKSDN